MKKILRICSVILIIGGICLYLIAGKIQQNLEPNEVKVGYMSNGEFVVTDSGYIGGNIEGQEEVEQWKGIGIAAGIGGVLLLIVSFAIHDDHVGVYGRDEERKISVATHSEPILAGQTGASFDQNRIPAWKMVESENNKGNPLVQPIKRDNLSDSIKCKYCGKFEPGANRCHLYHDFDRSLNARGGDYFKETMPNDRCSHFCLSAMDVMAKDVNKRRPDGTLIVDLDDVFGLRVELQRQGK